MSKQDSNFKTPHSQMTRHALFGSNTFIAIAIAVSIVIGVNWIGRRAATRLDLTRIKSYTLSEQTKKVLNELNESITIVTLFDEKGEMVDEARYLVDEYGRASDAIEVEHIAATDLKATRAFFMRMHDRYHEHLVAAREAIELSGKELETHLESVETFQKQVQQILDELVKSKTANAKKWQAQLLKIRNSLDQSESQLHQVIARVSDEMKDELPPYAPVIVMERQLFSQSTMQMAAFHGLFSQMAKVLVGSEDLKSEYQELLLSLADAFKTRSQSLSPILSKLNQVHVPTDYQRLRFHLKHNRSGSGGQRKNSRNPLIIVGKQRMVPMTLEQDLFLQMSSKRGKQMRIRHQGEERITSMLAAMSIEKMPLVVFAFPMLPQLDKENLPSQFGYVIKALQRRGFEVKMHTPIRVTREGQQVRQKVPEPAKGQRAVWVFVPPPPDKPLTPQHIMSIAQGQKRMAALIKERTEKGESAMVMVSPTPSATYKVDNPILPLLSNYGIDIRSDEIILHEIQTATDQSRASLVHEVNTWPEQSEIGRALRGLPAAFLGPAPMDLNKQKLGPYTVIAQIDGKARWADKNFAARKFDPQKTREKFDVGIAVSDDNHRMVVMSGQQWLDDNLAAAGEVNGRLIKGAAYTHGAKYPGNTDLFINSILWLSHQDDLILPAARSQDIARFRPMSIGTQKVLRIALLILVPVFFMIVGVTVYYARRRG